MQGLRKVGNQVRVNRDEVIESTKLKNITKFNMGKVQKAGEISNIIISSGPSRDELDGLDLEERKRKRLGPIFYDNMDISNNGHILNDSAISIADCAVSNNNILATLAK